MDTVTITDRTPISIWTKLNPLWWLVGPDGWNVPEINNGEPYLPEVKNIWLRRFYWFFCRNPLMNFVGFVLGVEDRNYTVYGSADVLRTTGRDCTPPVTGFRWAILHTVGGSTAALTVYLVLLTLLAFISGWALLLMPVPFFRAIGYLPYVNFWNGRIEAYLGWRPHSGGFGFKFVITNKAG